MSTTTKSAPIAPAGLLVAAKNGDLTAMLALSDWFGENGPPPDGDADGGQTDEDLPLGFLLLAQECERATVSLRHVGVLLDRCMPTVLPPWVRPPARSPNKRSAFRIGTHLQSLGFPPIGVSTGLDRTYRLWLPWDGLDRKAQEKRIVEFLTSVFPGTRYDVYPTRTDTNNPADDAAYMLGWMG